MPSDDNLKWVPSTTKESKGTSADPSLTGTAYIMLITFEETELAIVFSFGVGGGFKERRSHNVDDIKLGTASESKKARGTWP
ncbi:hypothetical protein BWQ96_05094 [Gracilariopsis chorda]|uniref:Uncharacterized protein n=1 Tax=Gracilariopsis chorda TaxID=448386 RepID=A0A2V3ISU5_9FLOR|nr:hypothetical protein BWQ96_05094 [Gracilariopsis chorda]|eukprot:PXF45193.1 hypothetical protein BWQ96_05094 [Gracilariopsis chorda]